VACMSNKRNGYRSENIGSRSLGGLKGGEIPARFPQFLMLLNLFNDAFHTAQIKKLQMSEWLSAINWEEDGMKFP